MQEFILLLGAIIIIIGILLLLLSDNIKYSLVITIGLFIMISSIFFGKDINSKIPSIILPEEYNQIRETDTLKGYYDSKGTLHIEFNNKRNKQQ